MNWGETKVFTWGELSSLTWGEIALDKFELLKSLAKKPDTPDEVLTKLADLCDSFVESYIQLDISKKYPVKYIPSHQSDRLGYIQLIENHWKPTFGAYKLKSLTSAAVQEYVNQIRLRGLARSSVVGILSVLNTSYEYAIEPLGYIKENPCQRVKMPRFERGAKER